MEDLKISLSEKDSPGAVSKVRVDGVIDTLTASDLEQVIESLLRREKYRIIVDLAGVDYISSAGWGIFIAHIRDVRSSGGDIKLVSMQPDVYEIFELLEFDNVLETFSSVGDAVTAFASPENEDTDASVDSKPKKKESRATRIEIVNKISPLASSDLSANTSSYVGIDNASGYDLETRVLCLVKNDPFAPITEIRNVVNDALSDSPIGWWRVFGILRRHRLLSRRSRFRLAWGRM